ncbi:uncharacterized protein LOC111101418 isoform X2 [Crassostrea virginica]|nr:uncharacterized protein LOC111101418 isoform X2 [Crassostrea virginica]XP_022289612.1 uncharacterized protein LOC111101418 isoform X2 [Crassostrea virginica]XP_022289613.1 uncharacterized protein LOC111101418 isoform X2 [Crassostrea virginica]
MDSVKILVFAVSLFLMLDGLKAQDLACNPCINYQVESNTLPPEAVSVVRDLHLNLLKDPTCNIIGRCPQPSNREEVRKCAVYQGDGTLTIKTGKRGKVTGGLEFRKCEEVSTNEPDGCTSLRIEDFKNINFFNDFLRVLPEEASKRLQQISAQNITITFDGSRCLNVAGSGASHFKNSDSRNASMFMVVLVLAMFPFHFEA